MSDQSGFRDVSPFLGECEMSLYKLQFLSSAALEISMSTDALHHRGGGSEDRQPWERGRSEVPAIRRMVVESCTSTIFV